MISSTSGPWAWTQGSTSTPTSLMHNFSFTSRLCQSCRIENLSKERPVDITRIIFGFTQIREAIDSTHRGILGTYTTTSRVNKARKKGMFDKNGGYSLPKALCIRGKVHKVIEYEGCCRIKSTKDLVVHKGSDVSNGTQPEEERMQGGQIIEATD